MKAELTKTRPTSMSEWWRPESLFDLDLFDRMPDFFTNRRFNLPAVNIKETAKFFELELAAPGLTRKDFDLEIVDNLLSITVEKEETKEEKNGYTRREFTYNSFIRTFRLPENVNPEKIDAKYKDGMLRVTIPKMKESPVSKTKHIDVE